MLVHSCHRRSRVNLVHLSKKIGGWGFECQFKQKVITLESIKCMTNQLDAPFYMFTVDQELRQLATFLSVLSPSETP